MTRVVDDTEVSGDEFLWFSMQEDASPGETIDHYWLYYDNPSASQASNDPDALFEYWNSFSATDPMIEFFGAATVSGGELVLAPGATIRTFDTWGAGHAVDFQLRMPSWGSRVWGGFQRAGDFFDDEPWALWITRSPDTGSIRPEFLAYETGMTMLDTYEGPLLPVDEAKRNYSVERYDNRIVWRREWLVEDDYALPGPFTPAQQARLTNESVTTVYFDFLRVRRTMRPAPVVTLGPEELRP
jgi:hypothetical protein